MKFHIAIFAAAFSCSVSGQSTFQNLDFESADLPPISAGQYGWGVSIASALPGWSASINGVPVTQVFQNNYTLGEASIDILGPNWNSVDPGIIDGDYTVFLQAFNTGQGNVSIWQDGTVPANAESLQFNAWSHLGSGASILVSFAGNNLSLVALSSGQSASGQTYTVYGANIASYAGQTGQLEFTSIAGGPDWNEFDDITFSTEAVPEPSPLVLTGVGGLLFALWRRFAPKRPFYLTLKIL